jgi:hypothetical protein
MPITIHEKSDSYYVYSIEEIEKLLAEFVKLNSVKQNAIYPLFISIKNKPQDKDVINQLHHRSNDFLLLLDRDANNNNITIEITNNNIKKTISLADIIYYTSLMLAKQNLINDIDFFTLEKMADIPEDNIIFTSDRYFYDVESLHQYLRSKTINPFNRQPFTPRDWQRIQNCLKIKYPHENFELISSPTYPGGDPNLSATLALTRELTNTPAPLSPTGSHEPPGIPQRLSLFMQPNSEQQNRPSQAHAELPTHSLPHWLSAPFFVRLPNGSHVFAQSWNNNSRINLVEPNGCERSFLNDSHVSAVSLLANGHIAVGHDDHRADIHICDTTTRQIVNRISQSEVIKPDLMVAVGNHLFIASGNDNNTQLQLRVIDSMHSQYAMGISVSNVIRLSGTHLFPKCVFRTGENIAVLYRDGFFDKIGIWNNQLMEISQTTLLSLSDNNIQSNVTILTNGNIVGTNQNKVLTHHSNGVYKHSFSTGTGYITCLKELQNNHLLIAKDSGADGIIAVYSTEGTLIHQAKINRQGISSSDALQFTYDKLMEMNAMQEPSASQTSTNTLELFPSIRNLTDYHFPMMGPRR